MRNKFLNIWVLIMLFLPLSIFAQNMSKERNKVLPVHSDTLQIDTLSLIPGSVKISGMDDKKIADSLYRIYHAGSKLYASETLQKEFPEIRIRYQIFPYLLTKKVYHKDFENTIIFNEAKRRYSYNEPVRFSPFDENRLESTGNIARGISMGNNQDVIVNANMNLKLNGKLSDNLNIAAAISDDNIPIQPDGHTQQLQEFDKVYISVYNDKLNMRAGDYQIRHHEGYFLKANKSVKGGRFSINSRLHDMPDKTLYNEVSGAISEGYYARKKIPAGEGNQGPYRLSGANNELNIIVIAGSEKVYMDGKLLSRGQNNDYVIDYNSAEISFTANQPITKDKRIMVEFEYSALNYARFTASAKNIYKTGKGNWYLHYYIEQDAGNQPLRQELTPDQKALLKQIGDNLNRAYVRNVDSTGFADDQVKYALKDTNLSEEPIFVYSTNPVKAVYQVGFSHVGQNKGHYVPSRSSANGKVYQWVSPVDNEPQGSYEPITLLVTPKKQELITIGGKQTISARTTSNIEIGISNHDVNTFSELDNRNNKGIALNASLEQQLMDNDKNQLSSDVSYQLIHKNFNPIERFRTVEFNRDWNLPDTLFREDEHNAGLSIHHNHSQIGKSNYHLNVLLFDQFYRGINNQLNNMLNYKGYNLNFNGSYLNSDAMNHNTNFLRHYTRLWKKYSGFTLALNEESENNTWISKKTDTLQPNSHRYHEYGISTMYGDSLQSNAFIGYSRRIDFLPENKTLKKTSHANNYKAGFQLISQNGQQLKSTVNYRQLKVLDISISEYQDESSLTGRIEHSARFLNEAISSNTFYETGSGLEPLKEFVYIKVGKGRGVYQWIDYNNNDIKELNEFEIANFNDEAEYIRVFSPVREYTRVVSNQFNQTLNIRFYRIWSEDQGIKKILSRFSNRFSYRVTQKNKHLELLKDLNPFPAGTPDSLVLNVGTHMRNTLSYNKTNRIFGIDYLTLYSKNKTLLLNGIDTKTTFSHILKARNRPIEDVQIFNESELADKKLQSSYFTSNNYTIRSIENRFRVSYEPGLNTRLGLEHEYSNKRDAAKEAIAKNHEIYAELKRGLAKTGNINIKSGYIHIQYQGKTNSPISYEMLEGFNPGHNFHWVIDFKKEVIKNMVLNLNYEGRSSENKKTIHIGNIQMRAIF